MSSSILQKSMHNMSLNTSLLNSSRRGRGDATLLMSNNMTHSVEPYLTQLPAMVRVALSSGSGDGRQFSCKLDPNGWGWLVTGRKLYVWRHTQDTGKKSAITCRELQLPPSDLPHNAKMVAVLPSSQSTAPACMGISPEGLITYWPNISNESSTVTLGAEVPGQECDSITSIWPLGCIATTTTSTILLIKALNQRGNKPSLSCAPLLAQTGWLGGWSKKMTNMLFSTGHASTGLDKRVRVVVPLSKDDDPMYPGSNREGRVYICQGSTLQTWQFTTESYQCLGQFNIDESLRRLFLEHVWSTGLDPKPDVRAIQTWILDIVCLSSDPKQLSVLVAAKSQYENTANLVYAVVNFDVRHRNRDSWTFIPMMSSVGNNVDDDEHQLHVWKLLATQSHFYVVCPDSVHSAAIDKESATDSVEASAIGGTIIGAGNVSWTSIVVLVHRQGLLAIKPQAMQEGIGLDDTFTDIRVPDHLALSMTEANLAELQESDDTVKRMQSAFLLFLKKKSDDCGDILNDLFPASAPHDTLDVATVAFAEKLIDEAPPTDPRWSTTFKTADDQDQLGIKSKILIKNFLVDKREVLELFFGFLSGTRIFPRLTAIVVKEDMVATASVLYNAYEKVYFALSLQTMQTEHQYRKVLDTAIRSLVRLRRDNDYVARSPHLSPNDIFYKQVSRVHQVIPALVSIEEEDMQSLTIADVPSRIAVTNEIILRAIYEINAVASGPGEKLSQVQDFLIKPLLNSESNEYQILPWLAEKNVLRALLKQHEFTVSHGIKSVDVDQGMKIELIRQLQQLTDAILDVLKNNLLSIKHSERYPMTLQNYENTREKLLRTHLTVDDYDGATRLADKYLDFEILTTVCYDKREMDLMKEYFGKFEELGFAEFAWDWYIRQGKAAELVDTFNGVGFKDVEGQLKQFLNKHPHISWHHATVNDQFGDAALTLRGLAAKQEAYADDKKFFLCLSKLACLANMDEQYDKDEFVQDVDRNLHLLEFQSRLPDDVLSAFGMERDTMRVLTPSEMIDMYTSSEVHFEADNFTTALGLVDFMINDDLRVEKRLLVASRAIQRDPWEQWTNTDHPMDIVAASCLYKYIITALKQGWGLEDIYPLDLIFAFPGMRTYAEQPHCRFLLTACYEHLVTSAGDMGAEHYFQDAEGDEEMEA